MTVEQLADLARRVPDDDGSAIAEFDAQLMRYIASENDQRGVSQLLSVFSDEIDPDPMWSAVHALESCPRAVYVDGLVAALGHLVTSAPDWAETLVSRCLNADDALDVLRGHRTALTGPSPLRQVLVQLADADIPSVSERAHALLGGG